ncbi:uncharacterized protein MELLADRAFT_84118 [Melampsora larici-populina 98AG31]|uniref:Secreted protein n=1 Tax=Melampsora larici-populina (strain 98AG31 / pathotype 3-4-7) TaxID=747676 RepID=F4SBJ8_MELLP|nr:uncharacterized protein MELLADRAFT_84118 [Melampsora larici-populina 98AG31]EGF97982.1 secreted protein [Melampsora larici-populina 98AG31]
MIVRLVVCQQVTISFVPWRVSGDFVLAICVGNVLAEFHFRVWLFFTEGSFRI